MQSIDFSEANKLLIVNKCKIFYKQDNGKNTSEWKVSFLERLKILLFGRIYISSSHPLIEINVKKETSSSN